MIDSTDNNQYSTPDKLNTRISIHKKYSANKQGFGSWIFTNYRIEEGMKVLELGCGTGEMWMGQDALIRRCSKLILTDLSKGMTAAAKENLKGYGNIEFCTADIQNIPFADNEFDAVIANMMLYHVKDLELGLKEVARVLKSDGTFYCATYGENGIREHIELFFCTVQNLTETFVLCSASRCFLLLRTLSENLRYTEVSFVVQKVSL